MERVAEKDGSLDRSGVLALLELEKRARMYDLSSGTLELSDEMTICLTALLQMTVSWLT